MPRFSLQSLIILMLLGGPALASAWWIWSLPEYRIAFANVGLFLLMICFLLRSELKRRPH
jgi:hypothetical protein